MISRSPLYQSSPNIYIVINFNDVIFFFILFNTNLISNTICLILWMLHSILNFIKKDGLSRSDKWIDDKFDHNQI